MPDDYYDDPDFCDWNDEPDEPELIIVCPDDMCRGSFDGEGPPCGRWQPSCVRYKERTQAASRSPEADASQ